jgi:hypothetical protein
VEVYVSDYVRIQVKSLLLILLLAAACDTEDRGPADTGKDYLPLTVGTYQVYAVDETQYNAITGTVELHYQLMTEVVDSFPATDGNTTYVIYRSKRNTDADPWTYFDTWSARVTENEAVVAEENISYVKLIFPAGNGRTWNGNKFNTGEEDDYDMTLVDQPYAAGDQTFDKTLRVDQEDNQDFIVYQDKRSEIFARGVGLIYKETTQLKYCTDPNCLGRQQVETGLIWKQSIRSYGRH